MFKEIADQLAIMEQCLLSEKGYTEVNARSITVNKNGQLHLSLSIKDDFQEHISSENRCHHDAYYSIFGDDVAEIWSKIYTLPSRAIRELTVLANQLSGISGMEAQLQSVLVQRLILPILEQRDELKKYLMKPEAAPKRPSDMPF